jgi:hypothetical protein
MRFEHAAEVVVSFHVRADILPYGFRILLRGELTAAATSEKSFGGFWFFRRKNHGESKNQVPAEAVLHHLP